MKNKRVKKLVKLWCHMNNICIVKKMKIMINNQALLNYILAINFETSKTLNVLFFTLVLRILFDSSDPLTLGRRTLKSDC